MSPVASRRVPVPWLAAAVATAALVVGGCGGGADESARSTAPLPAGRFAGAEQTPQTAPDFALRDQDGRLVRLSAERGKLVLITFLYTHCPDVCPLIAANLNEVLRKLGPERRSVRVLAVSVDPEGDTPAQARLYVRRLRLLPQFRYLIGSRSELRPIWRAYHVAVAGARPELVDHVAYVLLIDRAGKTRLLYDAQVRARDVLHDLRLLLSKEAGESGRAR